MEETNEANCANHAPLGTFGGFSLLSGNGTVILACGCISPYKVCTDCWWENTAWNIKAVRGKDKQGKVRSLCKIHLEARKDEFE